MDEVKLAHRLAQYSEEVTVKTHEIAENYKNWLDLYQNVPNDVSCLAEKLLPKLSENEMIEFTRVLDLVISMYDDNILNFRIFLDFLNHNIEQTEQACKNHQEIAARHS